jgi:hypothetical protein
VSVYVDPLVEGVARDPQAKRVGARNGNRWCHMMADTIEELHAFAKRIGMRRDWFQGDHYDLTPSRRAQALACGAIPVTARDLVKVRQRLRAGRSS